MAKKRSGNPKIETRVEREYLARFDVVLKRLQARQAKVLAADLMRVLLLAETRFDILVWWTAIGVIVLLIGVTMAGYYGMFYETSIPSGDGDRILNFGLALERIGGIIGGLLIGVIGSQVMVFSRR